MWLAIWLGREAGENVDHRVGKGKVRKDCGVFGRVSPGGGVKLLEVDKITAAFFASDVSYTWFLE